MHSTTHPTPSLPVNRPARGLGPHPIIEPLEEEDWYECVDDGLPLLFSLGQDPSQLID
ncbi:MAG: hypothetical protein KIT73_04045 [Burkholderiales bacterium]|nr:hypothetical protein [Burkholderiales bacterium]